jgi:hypothetical protein
MEFETKQSRVNSLNQNKINIILRNLNENTLKMILSICEKEKIRYTFDKDIHSESFDIIEFLDIMIKKDNKIPSEYKNIIEGEYREYFEEINDEITLEKLNEIEYI